MLITRDIEEIKEIFSNQREASVVLISQFPDVPDMRLFRGPNFGENIEFIRQGLPVYILAYDRLEAELTFLSKDYHFYTIPSKDICTHYWVDVGFRHTKMVCKHCDREQ